MKKILLLLAALLTATIFLTACGNQSDAKIKVVAAGFSEYDWARSIIGDDEKFFELTLLMDNGIDLHHFKPTARDLEKISACDVFIYVGGDSDAWADDALKSADKNIRVVNLTATLGNKVKRETQSGQLEVDEHVWLSLRNAQIFCDAITDALSKAAPAHATTLRAHNDAYKAELAALDQEYRDTLTADKTIFIADKFPFRYLVDDYGLKYVAAFGGCAPDLEADDATVKILADKLDELDLPCVIAVKGDTHPLAEKIIANSARGDQKILTLDHLQTTTLLDAAHGSTYLAAMKKNLAVLYEALTLGS